VNKVKIGRDFFYGTLVVVDFTLIKYTNVSFGVVIIDIFVASVLRAQL